MYLAANRNTPPYQIFSIWIIAIGFICGIKLKIVGEIYVGEVFFLLYFIANIRTPPIPKKLLVFLGMSLLWAIAQLVSDIVNGTTLSDLTKGVGAPIVFALTTSGIFLYLAKKPYWYASFILGALLAYLLSAIAAPSDFFLENPWKWGIGGPVYSIFFLLFSFFLRLKLSFLLLGILSLTLITLTNDARSMAFFSLFSTLLYIWLQNRNNLNNSNWIGGRPRIIVLYFACLSILFAANSSFTLLFSNESFLSLFSESAAQKYRTQAGGEFGILLGGRNESLVSIQAFLEKPFLGHGSWARDTEGYIEKLAIAREQMGYAHANNYSVDENSIPLIPTHSFMMGAAVWCGIVGLIYWLYILNEIVSILILKAFQLPLFLLEEGVSLIWSILFSPFGASARWSTSLVLVGFYLLSIELSNDQRPISERRHNFL